MSNLIKRTLTGLLFTATLLITLIFSQYSMIAMIVIVAVLCLLEFYNIGNRLELNPQYMFGILISVIMLMMTFLFAKSILPYECIIILIPIFFFAFIIQLYIKHKKPLESIAITYFPILYIILPLMLIILLGFITGEYNYRLIIGILILIWTSDTFAYLVGVAIGRHPLFPRISPKKSWEGFIGGLVFCCVVSQILAHYWQILSYWEWGILAFIVAITGVFGDLFESLLKREAAVKDSGTILPGHGGVLDRFDSLFIVMPFAYAFIYFVYFTK